MTNRTRRDELEERWLTEIVAALEHEPFVDHRRMTLKVAAQAIGVAVIEQFDGPATNGIPDAFVMRPVQRVACRVRLTRTSGNYQLTLRLGATTIGFWRTCSRAFALVERL